MTRPHINANGEFQSDKYPTCPPGKVPLSVKDPTAQDLLWQYAQRRRAVDGEFADDLEFALRNAGYAEPSPQQRAALNAARQEALEAAEEYYRVCAAVRCDSLDCGRAFDRLAAAIDAIDAVRKAGACS